MYCTHCGKEIPDNSVSCGFCGSYVTPVSSHQPPGAMYQSGYANVPVGDKEWVVALLLCIFLGGLGVHRFYTGHIVIGVLQLLTLGGCGIWVLIDLILILVGSYKDSDGLLLRK